MFKRTPNVWEVKLQASNGETTVEKVHSFWSPVFDGVKESIALAARLQAWIRNKKKVEFQAIAEPVLLGKLGDEGVAA